MEQLALLGNATRQPVLVRYLSHQSQVWLIVNEAVWAAICDAHGRLPRPGGGAPMLVGFFAEPSCIFRTATSTNVYDTPHLRRRVVVRFGRPSLSSGTGYSAHGEACGSC